MDTAHIHFIAKTTVKTGLPFNDFPLDDNNQPHQTLYIAELILEIMKLDYISQLPENPLPPRNQQLVEHGSHEPAIHTDRALIEVSRLINLIRAW